MLTKSNEKITVKVNLPGGLCNEASRYGARLRDSP
jgi:hypothetical protein